TISGLLDIGLNNAKAEGKSASNNAAYNNAGTSQITFRAQEDLGGGMKAGVLVESNIVAGASANGAFGTFQKYIFVGGGFGELSFGQRTNFSTTTATTAQPFGTALGSGYSGAFGRLAGWASNATGAIINSTATAGNRDVRADGSVRYDSPNMQGFTAGLSYKPKNVGLTANETAASTGHMNIGLNYGVGPMKVSYAYAKINNSTIPANVGDNVDESTKHNLLGANYNFGPATVYAGYTTSKADNGAGTTTADSRSWNLGLRYAVTGNVAVLANYLKDNDKTIGNDDRKLFALGLDYGFSKRTTAYARYETVDSDTNAAGGKLTTYSAGLRHTF
ncbi:MAG: porin, partial [Rhodocyclaceae bacterium]|nr:porin [Rhodocyclaceae bacterium]